MLGAILEAIFMDGGGGDERGGRNSNRKKKKVFKPSALVIPLTGEISPVGSNRKFKLQVS